MGSRGGGAPGVVAPRGIGGQEVVVSRDGGSLGLVGV